MSVHSQTRDRARKLDLNRSDRLDENVRLDRAKAAFEGYVEAIRAKQFEKATEHGETLGRLGFRFVIPHMPPVRQTFDRY